MVNFQNLILEPVQNFSIKPCNVENIVLENIDRKEIIYNQLKLQHLKDGERDLIIERCLEF